MKLGIGIGLASAAEVVVAVVALSISLMSVVSSFLKEDGGHLLLESGDRLDLEF